MLDYLDKFAKLPADIQQKISSQEVLLALDDLSARYKVDLAAFVMRVMVGEIYFDNLLADLIKDFDLESDQAELLEAELRDRVFHRVKDYLASSLKSKPPSKEDIERIEDVVIDAERNEEIIKKLPASQEEKLLPPPPLIRTAKSKASTDSLLGRTFFEEDAKDIDAFKKKSAPAASTEADRLAALSEAILLEADLSLPSEGLNSRFKQIIITYLRGIRTNIEVKETMRKPVISGGINFDAPQADRVLAIARRRLEEENKKAPLGKIKVEEGPLGFVLKKEEIDEALGKKSPAPAKEVKSAEYDLAAEIKKGSITPPPPKAPAEKIARKAGMTGGKKAMDDVKPPPVMSPIDELAYMDLVTFRRLDSDVSRRCRKIEDKISLLGKEGIDKQLEGIKAWRLNPVNKTYLSMGQESIAQSKNIDDIIIDFKNKGLNYLTRAEFEEIMDLNNRLRF